MSSWLTQLFEKREPKRKQAWGKRTGIIEKEPDEKQSPQENAPYPPDPQLEKPVAEMGQQMDSIQIQALKETEEARKRAKKEAKLAAREDTSGNAEKPKSPGEQQNGFITGESITEERLGITVQATKEANLPVITVADDEAPPEQRHPDNKPNELEPAAVPQKLDTDAIYDKEIELAIAVPVDPVAITKLFNYVQSTPDMKVLYTRGSWERGTLLTVALDKPLPFIGMISKIPGLKIEPGLPQKDDISKGLAGSLLGAKKQAAARIDLILKAD